jgi:hypothetical protein
MIVDTPFTFDMTVGQERRIPQDGDNQLLIPPTLNGVFLGLRPTSIGGAQGAVPIRESFLVQQDLFRNNQAAVSQLLLTLPAGLFELEMTLSTQFDYAGAVGTANGATIQLTDALGNIVRMLSRFAAIGTFVDYNRVRLLLRAASSLNLDVSITTVAQHLDVRAAVNAIRIL